MVVDELEPEETVPSVIPMGASPGGRTIVVEGGMMLCTGEITPVLGSLGSIVTGQKGMELMTKGLMLIVVVTVTVTVPLSEYMPVP